MNGRGTVSDRDWGGAMVMAIPNDIVVGMWVMDSLSKSCVLISTSWILGCPPSLMSW